MAPEQIRGTPPVSHKTDLYALGVVLYQLLVGKPPFEGSTPVVLMHSHLNEQPPRPSARVQEIPKALDELIVNLMEKSPTDRPWDAAVVGMKLSELREKVNSGRTGSQWSGPSNPPGRNLPEVDPREWRLLPTPSWPATRPVHPLPRKRRVKRGRSRAFPERTAPKSTAARSGSVTRHRDRTPGRSPARHRGIHRLQGLAA